MNPLRLMGTVLAFVIGLGGAALALSNLPQSSAFERGAIPAYVWINIVTGVVVPASIVLGAATALLLVRIDRRLDQLQSRPN